MISTLLVLSLSRKIGYVSFPSFQKDIFKRILPLPLIYAGNMMTGLGGTQQLRYISKKFQELNAHCLVL